MCAHSVSSLSSVDDLLKFIKKDSCTANATRHKTPNNILYDLNILRTLVNKNALKKMPLILCRMLLNISQTEADGSLLLSGDCLFCSTSIL